MQEQKTKKFILTVVIFFILFIILIIAISYYSSYKNQKLQKEKEERAARVKPNELLDVFSKTDWKIILGENCNADNKGLRENKFSWINSEGGAELMDGHNLNIIFTEANTSKCCGNINKLQEKLKIFFASNEFKESKNNINQENYIYAFENYGIKCVYGYQNVENKETFCELGVVCGRINKVFTDAYFQQIYNIFNNEKNNDMVVVDKLAENLDGKFTRGRVGYTFYLNADKVFISKLNKEGIWESLDKPEKERKIYNCKYLLDWKIPPSIADPTCKNSNGEALEYAKLYSEKYK